MTIISNDATVLLVSCLVLIVRSYIWLHIWDGHFLRYCLSTVHIISSIMNFDKAELCLWRCYISRLYLWYVDAILWSHQYNTCKNITEFTVLLKGQTWHCGSALDCKRTVQAINPALGAWFITKSIWLAHVVPGPV